VKKIVKELRDRQGIPSWWELQTYKGDAEELEKIRALYEPYLPLPNIGVHKMIADELGIKAGEVYQAIKLIRQEMGLPQYNDPALHGIELRSSKKKDAASQESTDQEEQGGEAKEGHEELPETAGAAINLGPTEMSSDQGADASDRAEDADRVGASPTPTIDGSEAASDQVNEVEGSTADGGTAPATMTESTEAAINLGPTHPIEPSEGSESSEAPEAVAVTRVEGNTSGEE